MTAGVLLGAVVLAAAAGGGAGGGTGGGTLVDAVRAGPAATVERLAVLGRTIDLGDARQVRSAIGPVAGVPSRRSASSGFVGYTVAGGEIVYNPDLRDRVYLGVALEGCVATEVVRARLRGAEFLPARSRTTVVLYEETPYRERDGTSFSFHEPKPGCVSGFGITQRKRAA